MIRRILLFSAFVLVFNILGAQDSLVRSQESGVRSNVLVDSTQIDSTKITIKKKKWVAALLAFPVIGITGAHRIYLGTEPYMPLVYLATLGGFGILPLVDFIVILCTPKDKLDEYFDDPKVFMWAH